VDPPTHLPTRIHPYVTHAAQITHTHTHTHTQPLKVDDDSLRPGNKSTQYPLTKESLLRWWKQERRVAAYNDPGWPLGHADVDYDRWVNATEAYSVDRANIYFEPYFVARTGDLPLYDERYRGYGAGDKALHFHLLCVMLTVVLHVLQAPTSLTALRRSL
jgi:hypothetical protein